MKDQSSSPVHARLIEKVRLFQRTSHLVWLANPGSTTALTGIALIQGLLPAVSAWFSKRVIDEVMLSASSPGAETFTRSVVYAITYLVAQVVMHGLSQASGALQAALSERVTAYVTERLMKKAGSMPDIAPFESPGFYDQLRIIQGEASGRTSNLLSSLVHVVRGSVTTVSFLVLLWKFHPLIPFIAFLLAIPRSFVTARLQKQMYQLVSWQAPHQRRNQYYQSIALSDSFAKELRIYDLTDYFIDLYRLLFRQIFQKKNRLRTIQISWSIALTVVSTFVNGAVLLWVIWSAVQGRFTPGDVALFFQTSIAAITNVEGLIFSVAGIAEVLYFARKMFDFFDMPSTMSVVPPSEALPVPTRLRHGITFQGVQFAYQGGKEALKGVSFHISPGEVVALVGANGAGKSTIVKLLSRLYDPTSGSILVDGKDLRDYNLDEWRRQFAVVFQDYVHYQLTVRHNIGFGQLARMDDYPRIRKAAEDAGAGAFIDELALGYDQPLGRHYFDDGVDLSGGQWQKLALARAFVRDAQILVCDEPTAALDPEAEAEMHERLRALAKEKITLIISHRMSTVKMADRIIVLEDGLVIEAGTHPELMQIQGRYANLFQLQAERYVH